MAARGGSGFPLAISVTHAYTRIDLARDNAERRPARANHDT
jgi:hypothetical protein